MRRFPALLATLALAGGILAAYPTPATVGLCEPTDAGNTPTTATAIDGISDCVGAISETSDVDWYQFAAAGSASIAVEVRAARPGPGGSLNTLSITLLDPAGADKTSTYCNLNVNVPPGTCVVQAALTEGNWSVGIAWRTGPAPAEYALSVSVADPPGRSCEPTSDAANDPTTAAAAPQLGLDTTLCSGDRAGAADQDWFTVAVATSQAGQEPTLVVGATGAGGSEVALKLVNPQAKDVTRDSCFNDVASECAVPFAAAGTWKVGVTGGSGRYALVVTKVQASAQRTCEPAGDASGDSAAPSQAPGQVGGSLTVCNGELSRGTDDDWFKFTVSPDQPGVQNVTVLGVLVPLGRMKLSLKDPNGAETCPAGPDPGFQTLPCQAAPAEGLWKAGVLSNGTSGGSYLLVAGVVRAAVTVNLGGAGACEPQDKDAANAHETAEALPMAGPGERQASCRGTIADDADLADWYTFRVLSDGAAVQIVLSSEVGDQDLVLMDTKGNVLGDDPDSENPDVMRLDPGQARKGTWKLGVLPETADRPAGYSITLSIEES